MFEIKRDVRNQNSVFYVRIECSKQGMGCEGACAHAHVRCVVARVRVRAAHFWACDVRSLFAHFSDEKWPKMAIFMPLLRLFLINLYTVDAIFP